MTLRLHAILLALNEEVFISEQLKFLYPFCTGISILTQYDRDYHGNRVEPDGTVPKVLAHPDPEGKISLVLRRFPDQSAARNQEMAAVAGRPDRGVRPFRVDPGRMREFHRPPDYFWIVDADDFYDADTVPRMLEHLTRTRPRAMRVHMRNYIRTWNWRLPREVAPTCSFAFVRPGVRFERLRILSVREFQLAGFRVNDPLWQWTRRQKLLAATGASEAVARAYGFTVCPPEVGEVHHAQWIGKMDRMWQKLRKSGNQLHNNPKFVEILNGLPAVHVPTAELPRNVREADWPAHFFDTPDAKAPGLLTQAE